MKKVAFYTLGCKVNQYETDALKKIFEEDGYSAVEFNEWADVYVINTCTVTNISDKKSRQMIRRAKQLNEDAIIVAAGCYSQVAPEEVSNIEGVNLVIGTKDRSNILHYINQVKTSGRNMNFVSSIMKERDFEELKIDTTKERTRAFLKIQEGCSQFCAYCIVPYARGPVRSRQPDDVIQEVKRLAGAGFKEVVLTGIHVASYGKDIKETSLLDIIKKVHQVDGIERIRLGSIEPNTVTQEFIDAAKSLRKLCPHYHLSMQSGCDTTLKRMNRKYTSNQYRKSVELLRENIADVALTTDVIVGFPGETEEEFEQTNEFIKEIGFSKLHVFKFSPRKGTPAATFPGQISSDIKERRSNVLIELSDKMMLDFNNRHIGRTLDVLFEQQVKQKKGYIEGLTSNYIRVISKGDDIDKGRIYPVLFEKAEEDYVAGTIVK